MTISFRQTAACAALCLAAGAAQVQAQEITLKIADVVPPTHFLSQNGTSFYMEEITRRTDGRVTFEYYPAQQLGKAKDMLTILQSGLADIALVVPSYMSEKLPLSGVVDLPGGSNSSCEGTRLYSGLLDEGGWLAENEFAAAGVRKAFVYVNPPYELFVKGNDEADPLDLGGAKIRSTGGATDLTVRELNGVPIRMAAPEIRESLSRGTIDGMVFPVPTVVAYKLEGLVDSATRGASLATVATGYMISDAAWDRLPEDIRAVMREVGEEASERTCAAADSEIKDTYDRMASEHDVTVIDVTDDQKSALEKVFTTVRADWAAQLDKRGQPGTGALDAYAAARKGTN